MLPRILLSACLGLLALSLRAVQPEDSWAPGTDKTEENFFRESDRAEWKARSRAENQRHEERYLGWPPTIHPCFIVPEGLADIAGGKWTHPSPHVAGPNWMFLGMAGYKFWSVPPLPETHALNDDGSGPQIPDHIHHAPPPSPPAWTGLAPEPVPVPAADPAVFERKASHDGPTVDKATWRIAIVPKPIAQADLRRGDIGLVTWDSESEGQSPVVLEAYSPVVNIVAFRPLRPTDDDPPKPPVPSEVLDTEDHPDENDPKKLVIPLNDDNDEARALGKHDNDNTVFRGPKVDDDLSPVVLEPLRPMLKTGWLHLEPPAPVPPGGGGRPTDPVRIFHQPQDADGNQLPSYKVLQKRHLILDLDNPPDDHPLRPLGEGRPVYLWIEGRALAADLTLKYYHSHEVAAASYAEQCAAQTHWDTLRFTVARLDLDIDSDNNNGFEAPLRSKAEDDVEDPKRPQDLAKWPGKLLQVNCGDLDGDGVPDWRDFRNDSGRGIFPPLAPLALELEGLSPGEVEIMFEYTASPPDATSPVPGFRLWNAASVNSTDKAHWPATIFKQLWRQGCRGHFGWCGWPLIAKATW